MEKDETEIEENTDRWFESKWGWYATIDKLFAKEKRQDFEYFFKMNIFDFLNHLCYLKDKADNAPKSGTNR